MNLRASILRAMHQSGLRLDDSATAADVAMRSLRAQRDALIAMACNSGMSYRQVAKATGVTKSHVHRVAKSAGVLSRSRSVSGTSKDRTVSPRQASECRGPSPKNPGGAGSVQRLSEPVCRSGPGFPSPAE